MAHTRGAETMSSVHDGGGYGHDEKAYQRRDEEAVMAENPHNAHLTRAVLWKMDIR
jgi:hypothetical protein